MKKNRGFIIIDLLIIGALGCLIWAMVEGKILIVDKETPQTQEIVQTVEQGKK